MQNAIRGNTVKKMLGLLMAASLLHINSVSAFGFGDLVSTGITSGMKVGGALLGKMTEASPDAKESKRQQGKAEREVKFHELVDKIEARADLTPLQKEQMVRQAAKTFSFADNISNLQAQQEARQSAERDKMLTIGGIAGVVGNTAMNSPSVVVARADQQVKLGIPRSESRRVIDQADAAMASGKPQEQIRNAIAALDGAAPKTTLTDVQAAVGDTTEQNKRIQVAMQESIDQRQSEIADARAAIEAAKPKNAYSVAEQSGLSRLDKGSKVFVEFIGGKKLTEHLQQVFKNSGFNVVATSAEAEVVYQFDGVYAVQPSASREGITNSVGMLNDDPKPLDLPKEKSGMSSIKSSVGSLFVAMAGIPIKPPSATGYKQSVLLVANRRYGGEDSRVSALSSDESETLESVKLIDTAMADLMPGVGFNKDDVSRP